MDNKTLAAAAHKMAAGGVDFRTIQLHFESIFGRQLDPAEGAALLAAWRASAPIRAERERDRAGKVAASARDLANAPGRGR